MFKYGKGAMLFVSALLVGTVAIGIGDDKLGEAADKLRKGGDKVSQEANKVADLMGGNKSEEGEAESAEGMPEMPPEMMEQMKALEEGSAKAAPYVAEFKKSVGEWSYTQKCDMMGMKMESSGTETVKMVGDFWITADITGDWSGTPFYGHMVLGYDAWKDKMVGTWVDSMGPMAMQMEGTFDLKTRTGTYLSECPDPVSGATVKYKIVDKWQDDNHRTMEMYIGDSPTPMMTNSYTRK